MDPKERREPTPRSLARGTAAFNVILWAVLAAFFFIVAVARTDDAYNDADLTLISGLKIIGSACGIVALLYSCRFLRLLDPIAVEPSANLDTSGAAAPDGTGPQQ
ncbi:hypothetical protein [Nocardioides sp. CER19]|uniref:hypothetical protein n=1 Tax=Nocardioides sp. CER19 TaxID=3038538 RepID=UPI00244CA599|nr:hypothetical protein [Nocardioides sp. CER19]MDH2413850.1 hypothetical protein [Nocardioides sp. CER19]